MANKTGQKYSETITFIRERLRFDLWGYTMKLKRINLLSPLRYWFNVQRLPFVLLNTTVIALRGYRGKPLPSSSTEISELDLNIEPIP